MSTRKHKPIQSGRCNSQSPIPNSVSACLIVRDEEANLARCLASIQSAVDEIVVVDTGSTDGTVEIATAAGARVFHFEWQDDFSAARNESLRQASGDWILEIDADEELVQPESNTLRALCASFGKKVLGSLVTVRSPADEQGSAETVGQQYRLFRNGRGIHFEGRIHEQLRTAEGWTLPPPATAPPDLWLFHRGYIASGDVLQRKGERNRKLLGLAIAEEPEQPAHRFNLGRQLVWEGRFDEALAELERALGLWAQQGAHVDGYVPSMFSTAALAANKLGRWDDALRLYTAAPNAAVSSELAYVAGIAAWRMGDVAQAELLLNRAWQDTSLRRGAGFDPSTASWRPLSALAELYESQGRTEDALACRERIQRTSNAPSATVSACLIVKDEERNLPRCLRSLQDAVDEIVVVDTGSSDQTVAIATSFGAKLFHFTWCDDFSAARNESLRHATGDWILWVDADDELAEAQPGALRLLCQQPEPTAYWLACHSLSSGSGEVGVIVRQCRLFRNHQGIQFQGRIHEQPAIHGIVANQSQVLVRHSGYIPSGDALDRKCERNRKLIQLELRERPDDPFLHYMLGKQYAWQHAYKPALEALEQAIAAWRKAGGPTMTYVGPLFAVAVCAALNTGQPQRALDLQATCPNEAISSDLLYYAAIACQRLGRLSEALQLLQRAVADAGVQNGLETDPSTASWRPQLLASQIHHALGQPKEAYEAARMAIELMPEHAEVLLSFASMARERGHPADARRAAERALASAETEEQATKARGLLDTCPAPELVAV